MTTILHHFTHPTRSPARPANAVSQRSRVPFSVMGPNGTGTGVPVMGRNGAGSGPPVMGPRG